MADIILLDLGEHHLRKEVEKYRQKAGGSSLVRRLGGKAFKPLVYKCICTDMEDK